MQFLKDSLVLNQGNCCPPGDIRQCLESFFVIANAGHYWHLMGRDQNTGKHLTVHRQVSTAKNDPTQSVSSVKFQTP